MRKAKSDYSPTHLTDNIVKALEPPATGNKLCRDTSVVGFGIRVTTKGAKSFILNYRTRGGLERRYTIGRHPDWPVATAREEAKKLKIEIGQGSDPLAQLEVERMAPTVADLCQRFLEEHVQEATIVQTRHRGDGKQFVLPNLGNKNVADIRFRDCDELHRKITRRGTKHRANQVIALLSKAFNLSIKWGWRDERDNPCWVSSGTPSRSVRAI